MHFCANNYPWGSLMPNGVMNGSLKYNGFGEVILFPVAD
jgi:hypothetical protein